jgi:hypothetical protein
MPEAAILLDPHPPQNLPKHLTSDCYNAAPDVVVVLYATKVVSNWHWNK